MPKGKVVARISGGTLLTGSAAEPFTVEDLWALERDPRTRATLDAISYPPRNDRLPALPYSIAASSCWSYNMAPRKGGPVGIAGVALRDLKDDQGVALFTLPEGWVWSDDPRAVEELRRLGR